MVFVSEEDTATVREILLSGGREAALAELRRRWPWLDANAAPATLDWLTTQTTPGSLRGWPRRNGPRT